MDPIGDLSHLALSLRERDRGYRDEVGLFRVDSTLGRIGRLSPGEFGYSTAAIARSRRSGSAF